MRRDLHVICVPLSRDDNGYRGQRRGDWPAAEEHFETALRRSIEFPRRVEEADVRGFHAMMLCSDARQAIASEPVSCSFSLPNLTTVLGCPDILSSRATCSQKQNKTSPDRRPFSLVGVTFSIFFSEAPIREGAPSRTTRSASHSVCLISRLLSRTAREAAK